MRKLALMSLVAAAAMLIATAAALAATTRPKDGAWKLTSNEGGFTVSHGGKKVSGIHFNGSKFPTSCPAGTITVLGSHGLRKGRDNSWLLGKPQSSGIGVAFVSVTAKQAGATQPAQMFLIFNTNHDDTGSFSDNNCSFNFAFKK